MATEPQRDIEQDLLAYKQRRAGQLGAPIELHPATRRMLQGEVARTAGRPLLTSEEAAKNFVRSFVMSHQQPGFFARHKPRLLWGGGMFACLAVVLLVLRNDPQSAARQNTFSDALPAPPPVANPQPATPQPVTTANRALAENETLARRMREPTPAEELKDALAAAPAATPAPGNPRGSAVASGPMPVAQREAGAGRAGSVAPPPTRIVAFERGTVAAAPTGGMGIAKAEEAARRQSLVRDADTDRKAAVKFAEKAEAGEVAQLAKALKPADTEAQLASATKKSAVEVKLKLADDLKREPVTTAGGAAGAGGAPPVPVAAPKAAAASAPATRMLAFSAEPGGGGAAVTQRFKQLDTRSLYRPNFNSPPVPQVMQDFDFERSGDRVRIVDADGSTYEGNVLPVLVEETRAKLGASVDAAGKEIKALADQRAQGGGAPAADAPVAYRFIATGLNRKLNQAVEFRGEWQPGAPATAPTEAPALQAASFGATRLEAKEAEKRKAPVTNELSLAPVRTDSYFLPAQPKPQSQSGRISGRAVVGGRNEFEINAVPK
jgi:hypothetical protein